MDRARVVNEFIPEMVRRLLDSHEYKQTLSEPFNLANMAGYLYVVILDRPTEEIEEALEDVENLDMEADVKYPVLYDKLFSVDYPYVQKFKTTPRTAYADLMEIHPDPAPSKPVDVEVTVASVNPTGEKSEPGNLTSDPKNSSIFQP